SPLNVLPTAMGVEHLSGEGVNPHAVDGEIAAPRGLSEVEGRVQRNKEAAVATTRLRVAPRNRKVNVEAFDPQDAERLADRHDLAKRAEHRLEALHLKPVNLEIVVLRLQAHQPITGVTADQKRAPASGLNRPRELLQDRVLGDQAL